MLWTRGEFPLAVLLTRVSLRLPHPFIPYIMGALLLISTISFLLIFEKETVALNFVTLFFNYVTWCIAALEVASPRKITH